MIISITINNDEKVNVSFSTGYHPPKDFDRYHNYLNTPRKTQFGRLDNYDEMMRSRSCPPPQEFNTSMTTIRGGESERGDGKRSKR